VFWLLPTDSLGESDAYDIAILMPKADSPNVSRTGLPSSCIVDLLLDISSIKTHKKQKKEETSEQNIN
jgi:hypothetical protein